MNVFRRLLDSLDNYLNQQENRRLEAYLAQAQNLEDLEYRMRRLDSESRHLVL
jgi:hypothetical protein